MGYKSGRGKYRGVLSASAFVGDGSGLTGISGSGVPGGSANHVQYNNGAGAFAGTAALTFDGTTLTAQKITASVHVSASTFYGDGSNLTGVSGGGGSPGGSNTHVQYNSGGSFAGSSNLTYDGTNLTTQQITASTHVSASTYYGDGSNLTGVTGGGGSAVDSDQTILAVQVFG